MEIPIQGANVTEDDVALVIGQLTLANLKQVKLIEALKEALIKVKEGTNEV